MRHARADYQNRIVDLDRKIPDDEPVFLIRGSDAIAPVVVREYARLHLRQEGADPEFSRQITEHAAEMERWQATHGAKVADL